MFDKLQNEKFESHIAKRIIEEVIGNIAIENKLELVAELYCYGKKYGLPLRAKKYLNIITNEVL